MHLSSCLVVCLWLNGAFCVPGEWLETYILKAILCFLSTEESTACPGEAVNYVCTTSRSAAAWFVSCHTSSPETSCDRDIAHGTLMLATHQSEPQTVSPCDNDVALLFMFNFIQGESNLSIAIPINAIISRLEISCESTCRYLHILGKAGI